MCTVYIPNPRNENRAAILFLERVEWPQANVQSAVSSVEGNGCQKSINTMEAPDVFIAEVGTYFKPDLKRKCVRCHNTGHCGGCGRQHEPRLGILELVTSAD